MDFNLMMIIKCVWMENINENYVENIVYIRSETKESKKENYAFSNHICR